MSSNCPICDQTRPWNCDCTDAEKGAFYKNLELEDKYDFIKKEVEGLKRVMIILLQSLYKPARQITKEEEAELDAFMGPNTK